MEIRFETAAYPNDEQKRIDETPLSDLRSAHVRVFSVVMVYLVHTFTGVTSKGCAVDVQEQRSTVWRRGLVTIEDDRCALDLCVNILS